MSRIHLPLLLCLTTPLCAQDRLPPEPGKPAPEPSVLLEKALQRMTRTSSLRFSSTETQNSSMARMIMRQAGGMLGGGNDVDVQGSWQDGILRVTLNQDADELCSYRGRQIARNDDSDWKLRRDRLVNGSKAPFILNPSLFFEALAAIPKAQRVVRRASEVTYKEMPVQLLSLSLSGSAAQDFALSGALPAVQASMGSMVMMAGFGGKRARPMPELSVDLALYVDPRTGNILKVRTRCDQKSNMPGNMQIQIGGPGGAGLAEEEEEEEETKELDKNGKRIYKRGLPVRKLDKDISRMHFNATFSQHGHPLKIQLSDRAKRLLRIGQ